MDWPARSPTTGQPLRPTSLTVLPCRCSPTRSSSTLRCPLRSTSRCLKMAYRPGTSSCPSRVAATTCGCGRAGRVTQRRLCPGPLGMQPPNASQHPLPSRPPCSVPGLTMAARATLFLACSCARRPTTCSSGRSGAASHSHGCCSSASGVGRRDGSRCSGGTHAEQTCGAASCAGKGTGQQLQHGLASTAAQVP